MELDVILDKKTDLTNHGKVAEMLIFHLKLLVEERLQYGEKHLEEAWCPAYVNLAEPEGESLL